jgi:hypothetical protein
MFNREQSMRIGAGFFVTAACFAALTFAGCERKERVVDVKAPGAEVTVDRNIDTGKVEVDAKRK